jgi:hypothetical protein
MVKHYMTQMGDESKRRIKKKIAPTSRLAPQIQAAQQISWASVLLPEKASPHSRYRMFMEEITILPNRFWDIMKRVKQRP